MQVSRAVLRSFRLKPDWSAHHDEAFKVVRYELIADDGSGRRLIQFALPDATLRLQKR